MSLEVQLCVCGRYYLFILSCFLAWEMSQAHISSLFSPSFFTLHTVMFLMHLVTDQLSAEPNYVSFHISTYLRIRKHYGDETKQNDSLLTWANSVWGEILLKQHFALKHESLINVHTCVFRVNGRLDNYVCERIFLSNVLQVCVCHKQLSVVCIKVCQIMWPSATTLH